MKNKVNPTPEIFTDPLPVATRNGNGQITGWSNIPTSAIRRGVGYDYENERNKFILDMIHTSVLGGYGHLNIGQEVFNSITGYGLTPENRFLFLEDALAYAALYPQNAKVFLSPTAPPNPRNPRLKGKSWALLFVGKKEQQDMLTVITNAINMQNSTLDTVTTEEAQRPENQKTINDPAGPRTSKAKYTIVEGDWLSKIAIRYGITLEQILALEENAQFRENPDLILPGQVVTLPFNEANSRLPELVPAYSGNRVKQLLQAGGQPGDSIPSGLTVVKKELDEESNKVDPEVDLEDWTSNVPSDAGTSNEQLGVTNEISVNVLSYANKKLLKKVYYNPREKKYYCVFRTLAKNPKSFDIGGGEQAVQNISNFKFDFAVPEILKFADRDNAANRAAIDPSKVEFLSFYGSPNRPQPAPAGQSFWTLAVRIPESEIEKLSKVGGRSTRDESPSVLQRAKKLLENKGEPGKDGLRRTPMIVGEMKENIRATQRVLRLYHRKLEEENITPSMMDGVNLAQEAERLASIIATLEKYLTKFGVVIDNSAKVEIVCDAKYKPVEVFYNGQQFSLDDLPSIYTFIIFRKVPPRSVAFLFHSPQIAALAEVSDSELPPPIEFVQKYVYPSPIIKPTDIKNKQEENKKSDNKYPQEPAGTALGKNTFEVSPKKSKPSAKPKTKAEVEREFQKRFQIGNQAFAFYTSTVNNAGCETPLAKYLNDAYLIYQLFGGKSSFRQIVSVTVKILRDEVISLKRNEQLLMQGAGYVENPEQALLDIEREVNRQFFACFRVLGDKLAKEVLEPGGVPPEVQNLVKAGLTPPRGISLNKTPTFDFWGLWRKQLEQLIIRFVKQLILQAFRQLLLAASGCGPETVIDDGNNVSRNRARDTHSPYGRVRINDLVDYANIDLLEVARDLNIRDTTIQNEGRGNVTQLMKVPPSVEQLRQLNDDCSDLMVDIDVVAVLQGSGGQALIDSLYRGINLGTLRIDELSNADREAILAGDVYSDELTRYFLNSIQESVYEGDVRYATLNFSKELIVKYFKRLGQVLGPEISLGLEKPLDTKEAYCDSRDVLAYGLGNALDVGLEDLSELGDDDDTPIAGGLTKRQLRSQIGQRIEQNSIKIGLLCEMAGKDFDFIEDIQNFWDSIGLAQWFLDLLALLGKASAEAQGIQAKSNTAAMRALAAQEITPESLRNAGADNKIQLTKIYKFYERYFGDNYAEIPDKRDARTSQYVAPTAIKYNINQVGDIPGNHPHYDMGYQSTGLGRNASPPNNRSFGRLQLDYLPRDNSDGLVRVYFNKERRAVVGSGEEASLGYKPEAPQLLCEFGLEPYDDSDTGANHKKYKVSYHLDRAASILTQPGVARRNHSDRINRNHSNLMHIGYGKTIGNKNSKGGTGTRVVADAVADNVFSDFTPQNNEVDGVAVRGIMTPYINAYYNITRTVSYSLYANESVKDRVDDTIQQAAIPPFSPNGDPCNFGPDEQKAIATINSIQQRIFNFALNVAPLFNNGYALDTPDTVNMISAYLENKIIKDFRDQSIFGYLVQGMEFIARTCSRTDVDESGIAFNPALVPDPEDQIKYVIRQMLRKTFYNMSSEADVGDDNFSGWGALTRNLFEEIEEQKIINNLNGQPALDRRSAYEMLARYMYTGNTFGTFGNKDLTFSEFEDGYLEEGGGLGERLGFSRNFQTFIDSQFLAAVPIHLLVGLQYIFYDKVVAITDKLPTMAFYAKKRILACDQGLRASLDPAASVNYPSLEINQAQPKTLEDLIADDQKLETEMERQLAIARPVVAEEVGERVQQQQQQLQMGVVPPEERRPSPFPVEVGGRSYNNRRDLLRDKTRYQSLLERCNRIRAQKIALETRLGYFAADVARSEHLYKTTGRNLFGKSDGYEDFMSTRIDSSAYRSEIHSAVITINRVCSLGITQYGTDVITGGTPANQRAYDADRDLKVGGKDLITQADFNLSRQYHPTPPITKLQAFTNQKLGYIENLIESGMLSKTAGLRDPMEEGAFYESIIRAFDDFVGFAGSVGGNGLPSEAPPFRKLNSMSDFSIGNPRNRASRNNTVIGILANITKEVAELDESALFRDLGISSWDRDQRNRVEGIITEMTDIVARLGDG